jgi:hypothetical protein
MLIRGSGEVRYALGALAVSLLLASSVSAVPLVYNIQPTQSDIQTATSLSASADVTPDLLNQFPQSVNLIGTSSTQPGYGTTLTADVGLPGNFQDGANGIVISQMAVTYPEALQLFSIGSITVPLGGGTSQPVAFVGNLTSLNITLDANSTITSSLTPTQNPGEYLWAGLANLTISGSLSPTVIIPTVQTIDLPATPFSQSTTAVLAGTFYGDGLGSLVTVGIPADEIHNLDVSLPPIQVTGLDPLGLGLLALTFSFQDLNFVDLTASILYTNATPIPEPGTFSLLCLGLAGFSALRRNRDRS